MFTITRGTVQRLRAPAPEARAAAGAAIIGRRLYVVGGVGTTGLARRTLVLDLETERWTTAAGPTPREHLAVTTDGRDDVLTRDRPVERDRVAPVPKVIDLAEKREVLRDIVIEQRDLSRRGLGASTAGRLEGVGADRQRRQTILAAFVAHCSHGRHLQRRAGSRHRHARQDGPAFVSHLTDDACGLLSGIHRSRAQ